jgi:hypothetical protein
MRGNADYFFVRCSACAHARGSTHFLVTQSTRHGAAQRTEGRRQLDLFRAATAQDYVHTPAGMVGAAAAGGGLRGGGAGAGCGVSKPRVGAWDGMKQQARVPRTRQGPLGRRTAPVGGGRGAATLTLSEDSSDRRARQSGSEAHDARSSRAFMSREPRLKTGNGGSGAIHGRPVIRCSGQRRRLPC